MDRVVLRHLSGSKAHRTETFAVDGFGDILVGRDPAASVRYDPDRDDLVGRHHARLIQDPADRYRFTIVDLNSRNGTYVNGHRIAGPVAVSSGDLVQLGPGGPEFEFVIERDLDARSVAPDSSSTAPRPTRIGAPSAPPSPVGKATVERLVADAQRRTRRTVFAVIAAVVMLLGVGAAVLVYRMTLGRQALTSEISETRRQVDRAVKAASMSSAEIARQYGDSVVFIEVGWKLILTQTGEQLYHEYRVETDRHGEPVTDKAGRPVAEPVYVQLPDGRIEPALSIDRGEYGQNQPIGARLTGTGFVVTPDGFILTNRHVAASWETSYGQFPERPGRVVRLQTKDTAVLSAPPRDWVPAAARVVGRRAIVGKNVDGRLDYLDVTFAHTRLRVPAKLVRVSDRHDVAMIKVDLPQRLHNVLLHDAEVLSGQPVTILGYPSISPMVAVETPSEDAFNREPQRRSVPEPTVTNGLVGRVVRGEVAAAGDAGADAATFGDSYQLTANATGVGNSGGPVFDERGRVIAIFYAARAAPDARVTFAVPIRYGLELMSAAPK